MIPERAHVGIHAPTDIVSVAHRAGADGMRNVLTARNRLGRSGNRHRRSVPG